MALSVGAFRATLGLDTSGYASGILNAQSLTSVFGETITNIVNNPLTGMIGALKSAAGAAINAAGNTLDYAETIQRVALNANIGTDTLQILRELLEDEGLAADGATAAIEKFNLRLGDLRRDGGPAKDALKDLKIDVDALGDGDTALRTIIESLARTEDAGIRASLAADLFDKQFGSKIVEAVRRSGGSLEALKRQFGALIVDPDTLRDLGQLDDQLDSINNLSGALVRGGLSSFFSGFARGFGEIDLNALQSAQGTIQRVTAEFGRLGEATGKAAGDIRSIAESMATIASLANTIINITDTYATLQGAVIRTLNAPIKDAFDVPFNEGAQLYGRIQRRSNQR